MQILIAVALTLLPAASVQAAGAQQRPGGPTATIASIVGRYEYRDKELAGYLELRADRTFEYKVDGLGPPVKGEGQFHLLARGVWRFDDFGNILMTNAPTTPPVFRQVSAVRDASVRAAFSIVATDGKPVGGLGVLTNDGEDHQLNMLTSEGWTIPLYQEWDTDEGKKGSPTSLPRNWEIVRSSDDMSLMKITLQPGGPNRYVFSYTPSPVAIFQLAAGLVAGEPDLIEVEFGTASIKMRRVFPR